MSLEVSEIVNIVVAILFAVSEVLPFIRNTEANGVIDFIRIFCTYLAIKLSRAFGVQHDADRSEPIEANVVNAANAAAAPEQPFKVDFGDI